MTLFLGITGWVVVVVMSTLDLRAYSKLRDKNDLAEEAVERLYTENVNLKDTIANKDADVIRLTAELAAKPLAVQKVEVVRKSRKRV